MLYRLGKTCKTLLLFLLVHTCLLFGAKAYGQYSKGVDYFNAEQYELALRFFNQETNSNKKDLILKKMISFYETNQLVNAKQEISKLLEFKRIPEETYLYVAKIYHAEESYSKAIEFYKQYLRLSNRRNNDKEEVKLAIRQCATGLKVRFKDPYAYVNNMGVPINSTADDINFQVSPNYAEKVYFSTNRNSSSSRPGKNKSVSINSFDIMSSTKEGGAWNTPISMPSYINGPNDEIILNFNDAGNVLIYLQGPNQLQGYLRVDSIKLDSEEIHNGELDIPMNSERNDSYIRFFNDSTIIYSSIRPGGNGGFDIYIRAFRNDRWMQPINIGGEINSPYDEVSPFLTNDGKTIYYSSNSPQSTGGYDIFKSTYDLNKNQWSKPENLGKPINSSEDDMYFTLSNDGLTGNFSSNRKTSIGQMDIYLAYLKNQNTNQLAIVPEIPLIYQKYQHLISQAGESTAGQSERINNSTPKTKIENVKEFIIEPLYVNNSQSTLSLSNKQDIQVIVDLMKFYPSIDLNISGFSSREGQVAYDLYFSGIKATKVKSYLMEVGIPSSRINVQSYGSSYPSVMENPTGNSSKIALKINNRIEFEFTNIDNLPVDIYYKEPIIAEAIKNIEYIDFVERRKGLVYRVTINKGEEMFQNQVYNLYDDPFLYKKGNETQYTYTLGMFKEYKYANRFKSELANYQLNNLKIIPFLDGVQLNKSDIINYTKSYPDLINYIQYNE